MKYYNIIDGIFINRPNRFIANVLINGEIEQVHVKNTGRCKEILIEGTQVYLEKSNNPNRKTKYSLISAYKNEVLINIDSQVPNQVIYDAIMDNKIQRLQNIDVLKREITYGNSRFDLYYEKGEEKGFIEVKGVTLEKDGLSMFPDAPTERGTKHINELIQTIEDGYNSYIIFLIQMDNIKRFTPNEIMDEKFSQALKEAKKIGVNILSFNSRVLADEIIINEEIRVLI